ncbi:MAG: serine/threonine-protein kinase, partial [Rhodothermales bacterium]|nr:serine/threonine-protein kinase [Rhodothermales bacterium]
MIGTTLSHYRIVSELGRGGMGIVYLAEDTKLDRQVAIKVLPPSALSSEDDRARFYREAKAAAALNHSNIAQIYQIDEAVPSDAPHGTQPSPFIAMEYIDGEPLDDRIKRGPLKISEALRLAAQIAGALGEAHEKGIVHRDVKASNVMLTSKGDAKVLDFGLALTAASTKLTRMGSTLGTVAYMSPEQARGEEVDNRTDLWAVGVVLYEMVAGRNPFGGDYEQAVVYGILNAEPEPLTAVRTGVPMELERITNKALAKDASRRYQTAADLLVDLNNLDQTVGAGSGVTRTTISHHGLSAGPLPAPPPATESNRPPWPWMAASLVLGMLLVFGAFSLNGTDAPKPRLTKVDIAFPTLAFPRFPTMSPTGEYLALMGSTSDGQRGIFIRNMQSGDIQYVRESDNAGDREMGLSPDGSRLAYNAGSNGGLFVMEMPSGIPSQITEYGRFAYWESNEVIVMTD